MHTRHKIYDSLRLNREAQLLGAKSKTLVFLCTKLCFKVALLQVPQQDEPLAWSKLVFRHHKRQGWSPLAIHLWYHDRAWISVSTKRKIVFYYPLLLRFKNWIGGLSPPSKNMYYHNSKYRKALFRSTSSAGEPLGSHKGDHMEEIISIIEFESILADFRWLILRLRPNHDWTAQLLQHSRARDPWHVHPAGPSGPIWPLPASLGQLARLLQPNYPVLSRFWRETSRRERIHYLRDGI